MLNFASKRQTQQQMSVFLLFYSSYDLIYLRILDTAMYDEALDEFGNDSNGFMQQSYLAIPFLVLLIIPLDYLYILNTPEDGFQHI